MALKRINIILIVVTAILLIPLLAMQFTNEVDWNALDFLVAACLLTGTGLLVDRVLQRIQSTSLRWVLISSILIVLLLIWAELAVGLFGTPFAGN